MRHFLLAVLLPALAAPAAAQSGIELFVVPNSTRSITAALSSGATFFNLGSVLVGSSTVSNSSITVTNTGTRGTTLSLSVSAQGFDTSGLGQHWVAASTFTSVSTDTFALYGLFQSTRPAHEAFTIPSVAQYQVTPVNPTDVCASTAQFKGGQSGVLVPANPADGNAVGLWLRLVMPTHSSNIKQKRFSVTVATGGCGD